MYDKLWQLLIDARTKNKYNTNKGYQDRLKEKKSYYQKENQPLKDVGSQIVNPASSKPVKPVITKRPSNLRPVPSKPRIESIGVVR